MAPAWACSLARGYNTVCGRQPCDSVACTWSEAHRAACEAREVMRWPGEKRKDYYAKVRQVRGDAALAALIADVNREWRRSCETRK